MATAETNQYIVDITLENFQQVILEGSRDKLVLVDFWADWCEPCKQLMPVLEKLATEFKDRVILAKINCDQQEQLAAQFGVRSLPTVAFFKDGQPVDGFAGVEPEQQIRARIEQHVPGPADDLVKQAQSAIENEDYNSAYELAKQAYDLNADDAQARLLLADAAVSLGRLEQAKELLDSIRLVDQDSYYQHVTAKLEIAEQAADSPELKALSEQVEAQPDDHALRLQYALALHQANRSEDALENAFTVLRQDLNFEGARKTALDILNALPKGDPLAAKYRRVLYSMMY